MRRILRWLGVGAALLAVVAAVVFVGARLAAARKLNKVYPVRELRVPEVPRDEISLAEGKRLFFARGCAECHGADGGGRTVIDDPAIGKLSGTNLTGGRGGVAARMKEIDFVRAVKHCVSHEGLSFLLMPCDETGLIPDDELGKILAHVQQLEPVDRDLPVRALGPLAHLLFATGALPLISAEKIDFDAEIPPAPRPGPTTAFGERLAQIQCVGCHGAGLSGGAMPGMPPGLPIPTNITPDPETGIGQWKKEHFVQLLRTGKRPNGSAVDAFMPWSTYQHLNDEEIEALWLYVKSRPARPFGNR